MAMSRFAVFLLLAFAALAQASLPSTSVQDKPLCKDCEKVITALKKVVQNPNIEQKLETALGDICNLKILSKFKQTCLNLVTDVVVVIHELQSLFDDPTKLCDSIKLCDAAPGLAKRFLLSYASKVVQDVQPPESNIAIDTCKLCTEALDEAKKIVENSTLFPTLTKDAEQVCTKLGRFQKPCDNVVDKLFQKLQEILEDVVDQPQQTCTELHLCKSKTSLLTNIFPITRLAPAVSHPHLDQFLAKIANMETENGLKIGCLACKTGVGAALKYLDEATVLTTIAKDATNLVCKFMPSSQKDACLDFLGIYAKPSIQLTVEEWTPDQICEAAHMCSKQTLQQLLSVNSNGKIMCDACKALTKILAKELQQPQLQQDIINVLSKVCKVLPSKFSDKCGDMVIQYVPAVLKDAADFFSRDDVCTALHAC